jgi:hypothetical protein
VLLPATGGLPIQGNTPSGLESVNLAPLAQRWQPQHQIARPLAAEATDVRPFRADYVLWVRSQTDVAVLKWNDAAQTWDTVDTSIGYSYSVEDSTQYIDLQVPFDVIGIDDPAISPLSLLAFASEDNLLRVWATAPRNNPTNSPRLIEFTKAQVGRPFVMLNTFNWSKVDAGQCPNGMQSSGATWRCHGYGRA